MKTHKIAAIAGDGIGKEVLPEGLRVVEAAARGGGATPPPGTIPSSTAVRVACLFVEIVLLNFAF